MIAVRNQDQIDADARAAQSLKLRLCLTVVSIALVAVALAVYNTGYDREVTLVGGLYMLGVLAVMSCALIFLFINKKNHLALRLAIALLAGLVALLGGACLQLMGHPLYVAPYSDAQYEKDRQAADEYYTAKAVVDKRCWSDAESNETGFTFFKVDDHCVGVRPSSHFTATIYSKGEVYGQPRDDVFTVVFPAGQQTTVLLFDPKSDSVGLSKKEVEAKLGPDQRHWMLEHLSD